MMKIKIYSGLLFITLLSTSNISLAGFFDQLERIKNSSSDMIESASDNLKQVTEIIKEKPSSVENKMDPDQKNSTATTQEATHKDKSGTTQVANKKNTANSNKHELISSDIIKIGSVKGAVTHFKKTREGILLPMFTLGEEAQKTRQCSNQFVTTNLGIKKTLDTVDMRLRPQVQLQDVVYKNGKCYFQSVVILKKPKRTASATRNNPFLSDPSAPVNIGTVIGELRGILNNTEFTVNTFGHSDNSRSFYCGVFINSNPATVVSIPLVTTNRDGFEVKSRVEMHEVILKDRKCYFDSIRLLKLKEDKRIVLKNVHVETTQSGRLTIVSSDRTELIKQIPYCSGGSFKKRVTKNNKDYRIPQLNSGSVVNLYGVSQQGPNCTYEQVEILHKAKKIAPKPINTKISDFKSDPTKKYLGEGNVLIGTLSQDVSLVLTKAPDNPQKIRTLQFTLSNTAKPALKLNSCLSYRADKRITAPVYEEITLNKYRKMARRNTRLYLTHVRPSKESGVCLYSSARPVEKNSVQHNLTQSMVSNTTKEQKNRRDYLFEHCQSKPKIKRQFRCDCMADKSLQALKLSPKLMTQDPTTALLAAKDECANISGYVNYEYKECMKITLISMRKSEDVATEYCQCFAKQLETNAEKYGIGNIHNQRKIKSRSTSYCSDKIPH